jgi:glycine betaine/proline transport system substrate-binding protein
MRSLLKTLVLALVLAFGLAGGANAKEKVVLGELNWTGSTAITHVLKVILEDRIGVDVGVVQASGPVIWAAMDKGKGGLDVYTDLWMPNQSASWAKFVQKGSKETVLANSKPYTGVQGLFIPGFIQDEHGIKSVFDLASPEIAKLFDTDGDGKGEYWPGGPGWSSTNVEQVKAKSYGYDKFFEPFVVEQWVMEAKLSAAFKRKKPILFYFWTPEWIHSAYDLRRLEEPEFDGFAMTSKKDDPRYKPDGCWNMIDAKESEDWMAKSSVKCAWADANVYVGYSASLTKRAPKAAKFLSQVSFDPKLINEWILAIAQDKREPAEVAKDWIAKNPNVVNEWLKGI